MARKLEATWDVEKLGLGAVDGACVATREYGVEPYTPDRAQIIMRKVIDGAPWPGPDRYILHCIQPMVVDLAAGAIEGAVVIIKYCNLALDKDPNNAHASKLRERFTEIKRQLERGWMDTSAFELFYETVHCVCEIKYSWETREVVEEITKPL